MRTPLERLVNTDVMDIKEFYNSCGVDLDDLEDDLDYLLRQGIVDSSEEEGLQMFEKDMRIIPSRTAQERKAVIKSNLMNAQQINLGWLRRKLALFGGRYRIDWDYKNNLMTLVYSSSPIVSLSVIINQLDLTLPAFICFDVKLVGKEELQGILHAGGLLREHKEEWV